MGITAASRLRAVTPVGGGTPANGAQTLLHLDGNVTDTGSSPKTWTVGTGATPDTTNFKFGGGSYAFDGSVTSGLQTPDHIDFFLNGDFTIDGWVKFASANSFVALCGQIAANGGSDVGVWWIGFSHATRIPEYVMYSAVGVRALTLTGTSQLTDTGWHHLAVTRAGSIVRLFVDGVVEATGTLSTSYDCGFPMGIGRVGAYTSGQWGHLNGNIDEFRIIKGLAVWTSSFTPPSAPYTDVPPLYLRATGGTVTIDGNYKVHTFNSSGTFTVTALGSDPVAGAVVDYLVVAGGGGGGSLGNGNGGGGAGGLLQNTGQPVTVSAYPIIVGGGGAGGTTASSNVPSNTGANGSDSSFGTIATAIGGGGGGGYNYAGSNGGSGGGAAGNSQTGGTGVTSQGNSGGVGGFSPNWPGGGGGGANAAGGAATNTVAGAGGAGVASSITGASVTYATGGNGGVYNSGGSGAAGTVNRGNGGGGGNGLSGGGGGTGGSGVVIIRYRFQ